MVASGIVIGGSTPCTRRIGCHHPRQRNPDNGHFRVGVIACFSLPSVSASLRRRHLARRRPTRRGLRARSQGVALRAERQGCFRIGPVAGTDLGVIATRDIACGELVVAEAPAIAVRNEDDSESVQRQFESLPDARREAVMGLHDHFAEGGVKTLEGIIRTSCYACEGDACDVGLFLQISRFNHSCAPNCEHCWDEAAFEKRVFASTAIREGEELCIYYIDVIAPRRQRAATLREMHSFTCKCSACSTSSVTSDKLRSRMRRLERDVEDVGMERPKVGLRMVSELLDLYDQEGVCLTSLRRAACFSAFQLSVLSGKMSDAQVWIERSCEYSKWCAGPQHAETLALVGYARDPRGFRALLCQERTS